MLAEAFEDGRSTACIYLDEIDKSAPMQEMGKLVWEAFTNGVRHRYPNTVLAHAVEVMNFNQHLDWEKVLKRDCETLLTAFHVTYQDNSGLKGEVNRLIQHIDPIFGVFSCYTGNLGRMRGVFPFGPVHVWDCGNFPKFEEKRTVKFDVRPNISAKGPDSTALGIRLHTYRQRTAPYYSA